MLQKRKVSQIVHGDFDKWDTLRLRPYHATDIHEKVIAALQNFSAPETVTFEPNAVWATWKGKVKGVDALTQQEKDLATQQIKDYLIKFDDAKEDEPNEPMEDEATRRQHEAALKRIRETSIEEYKNEWDHSKATDVDRDLLMLYKN